MTTAVCKACGELKFGAWLPCDNCRRTTNSLFLSDHYLTEDGLKRASESIKQGMPVSLTKCWRHLTAKAWFMVAGLPFVLILALAGAFGHH